MEGFYTDNYKRVWGNRAINGDIVITDQNNLFTVETDDSTYDITISPGTYFTEYTKNYSELIDEFKSKVTLSSFPVEVSLGGYHMDQKYNTVVVKMTNGKDILNLTGSFFDQVF